MKKTTTLILLLALWILTSGAIYTGTYTKRGRGPELVEDGGFFHSDTPAEKDSGIGNGQGVQHEFTVAGVDWETAGVVPGDKLTTPLGVYTINYLINSTRVSIVELMPFHQNVNWTIDGVASPWTLAGDCEIVTPPGHLNLYATGASASQASDIQEGEKFRVSFRLPNDLIDGVISVSVGGTSTTAQTLAGTYTETVTAGNGSTVAVSIADASIGGSVDDITIHKSGKKKTI